MKNVDTRVRYTKDVLQSALLELLKEKNIDRITVKELCDKAKINRGTFYLHYSCPYDLLLEIENAFMNEHLNFLSSYMFDSSHQKREEGMDHLNLLFKATLENKELCRVVFGPNGDYRFNERIKKQIRPEVIKHWTTELPKLNPNHLEYIFDYVFSGSMSLIFNWINDENSDISVEQLANRLDRLGHYAHLAVKEFI